MPLVHRRAAMRSPVAGPPEPWPAKILCIFLGVERIQKCAVFHLVSPCVYCSTVAIASKAFRSSFDCHCCQSPAASATQGRTLPRAPVAAESNGPGYWLPCSAFPKPWLPRSHGMKGRYKAVLHASYSSCASWRTAAAACSTSCSVFVCEKLNRTTPCSTVPNTLCINGAQCAPARTQMP